MEEVGCNVAVNDNTNIVRFLMLGLFLYLDCIGYGSDVLEVTGKLEMIEFVLIDFDGVRV